MIDLHMHSRYSDDGEFAPEELVRQCCECDITVMSVTDHNCARANGEAEQAAQRYGIRYIPGIEIDCTYKGVDFHVLGYGIDWRGEDFASVEENIHRQCIDGSHHQLLKTLINVNIVFFTFKISLGLPQRFCRQIAGTLPCRYFIYRY